MTLFNAGFANEVVRTRVFLISQNFKKIKSKVMQLHFARYFKQTNKKKYKKTHTHKFNVIILYNND